VVLYRINKCKLGCLVNQLRSYYNEHTDELREIINTERKKHITSFEKKIAIFQDVLLQFFNSIYSKFKRCTVDKNASNCMRNQLVKIVGIKII
jgi:hypothetical protein